MNRVVKILLISGARPNFMKIAPLIHCIGRCNEKHSAIGTRIEYSLVHTGQHYDSQMSDVFFRELAIPHPNESLNVGSGSHAVQTAAVMTRFEPVCQRYAPDWVVVVGDVNSTVACTLVATKLGVRVAHIEAGLRSRDRTMPEEINRIVTDSIADLLLTPSSDGDANLLKEGIPADRIVCVGNIMIDALVDNLPKARESRILQTLRIERSKFVFATLHRPSNVDSREGLRRIIDELKVLADEIPVVFPIHPRTRKMCEEFDIIIDGVNGLKIIEPVGYHDSLWLTENARFVLTDSGGLQEESTYFRTPCLTLRPNTERPITIQVGSNQLTSIERLKADILSVLEGPERRGQVPPLWDGLTADRVLESLIER